METDASSIPINGNYAPHQGYGGIEKQNSYAYTANTAVATPPASTQPPPTSTTPATTSTAQQSDIPKDEVGWYFVEQYYTTLSRNPEKLYLFYNKRSQFVSGQETDKVQVCVGQRAINERIKELDFQDCKVRVTNVDSQASDSNIVIQVIGEISNKSQPHKKFTQTFILATQTNGYFVLNDIFRYLIDEEDEPEPEAEPAIEEVQQEPAAEGGYQEPPPTLTEVESMTLTSSTDPAAIEHDAQQDDREIEDKVLSKQPSTEETVEPTVNGVDEEESELKHAEDAPAATLAVPAQTATPEPEQTTVQEPEQPPEPEPTPSPPKEATPPPAPEPTPSPPKEATPPPAPAPKPAAPKTWASMAASANRAVATPAAPPAASSTSSQARPTPPKTSTPPASMPSVAAPPVAPAAPAAQLDDSPTDASQGDEWTAVGGGHNRQQSRQTNVPQQEGPITRAYIKNVHEGITPEELRTAMEVFGELVYFDISRQRNSAFIEFKTPEGYVAATAANPHNLGGERLYVEERRPFIPRANYQGGRGRGGGGNQGQQRGNYQGRGGGYQPRGRGNASAPRARGGSAQAA